MITIIVVIYVSVGSLGVTYTSKNILRKYHQNNYSTALCKSGLQENSNILRRVLDLEI